MIEMQSGKIWVLIGAVIFGVAYAAIVYIPLYGKHAGYTSLLVTFGVGVTLAVSTFLIGLVPVLWVIAAFVCTGAPMIAGEAIRTKYDEFAHRRELAARMEEVTHADETTSLAEQCGLGERPSHHGSTGGA